MLGKVVATCAKVIDAWRAGKKSKTVLIANECGV